MLQKHQPNNRWSKVIIMFTLFHPNKKIVYKGYFEEYKYICLELAAPIFLKLKGLYFILYESYNFFNNM